MSGNTENLRDQAVERLDNLIDELHAEGVPEWKITRICQDFVQNEIEKMYQKRNQPQSIDELIGEDGILDAAGLVARMMADSKAEIGLLELLQDMDIPHEFQYRIGQYRVDFLVCEDLIVELDGPLHHEERQRRHDEMRDAWLKKMGYRILRVPLWVFSMSPKAVIDEICDLTGLAKKECPH